MEKIEEVELKIPSLGEAESTEIIELTIDIGQKVKSLKRIQGQYIGLTKISKNKTKDILNIWKKIRKNKKKLNKVNNLYITDFFRILIKQKFKLKAIFIKRNWLEFDTKEDLKINF